MHSTGLSTGIQSSSHASVTPLASTVSEGQPIIVSSRPLYATRPSSSSISSAQKIKKRVPWRGKTCIISLPNSPSRKGFERHDNRNSRIDPVNPDARTRPLFPDPEEIRSERADRRFRIRLPDKAQWDLYAKRLQEAKLRALGVSSGDEGLLAQKSPIVPPLYRHPSSHSSSLPVSPSYAPSRSTGTIFIQALGDPLQPQDAPGLHGSPALAIDSRSILEPSVMHFPRFSVSDPQQIPELPLAKGFTASVSPNFDVARSKHYTSQQTGAGIISPSYGTVHPVCHRTSGVGLVSARSLDNASLPPVAEDWSSHPSEQQQFEEGEVQHDRQDSSRHISPGSSPLSMNLRQSRDQWNASPGNSESAIRYPIPHSDRTSILEALERRVYDDGHKDPEEYGQCSNGDPSRQMKFSLRDSNLDHAQEPKVRSTYEGVQNSQGSLDHAKRPIRVASLASGLNALAPEFKVGNGGLPASTSTAGTTMRPTAPAFTPASMSQHHQVSHEFTFLSTGPVFKPVPYMSKAVPILKPKDEWSMNVSEGEVQEDESGRITQAEGRQKRQRRTSEDGRQNARFASPAHASSPAFGQQSKLVDLAPSSEAKHPHVRQDSKSLAKAARAADQLKEIIDDLSTSEDSSPLLQTAQSEDPNKSTFTFQDVTEAVAFDTARPRSSSARMEASPENFSRCTRPADEMITTCGCSSRQTSSPSTSSANKEKIDPQRPEALARSRVLGRESLTQSDFKSSERDILVKSLRDPSRLEKASESNNIGSLDSVEYVGGVVDGVSYFDPSYEELDAVMKHLNDENSIVRTNVDRGDLESQNPDRISAHDFQESTTALYIHDQNDTQIAYLDNDLSQANQCMPPTESESVDSSVVRLVAENARFSPSYRPSRDSDAGQPPCGGLGSAESAAISEWDKALSSSEEAPSKDEHVPLEIRMNNVVSKILEDRLMPLEESLAAIRVSMSALSQQSSGPTERLRSPGRADISDADDEDEDGTDCTQPVTRFPSRNRKIDEVKAMMGEMLTSQQTCVPASELGTITKSIQELKTLFHEAGPPSADVKTAVEEAIKRQMRGKSAPITSSHQSATVEKSQLQIAGLESMLKIAEGRADDEMKARRATEDALADSERRLRLALQDAAEQRESAEETEQSLATFHEERHEMLRRNALLEGAQNNFQRTTSELSEKNSALKGTLKEYRLSSAQWREEIESAKTENEDLRRTVKALRTEMEDNVAGREALRASIDQLQEKMATASQVIARDQSSWRIKEKDYRTRSELLITEGEQQSQKIASMGMEITTLSEKLRLSQHEHHQTTFQLEHQLHDQQERAKLERDRMQISIEHESKAMTAKLDEMRTQSEGVLASARAQFHQATEAADTERARLEQRLQEAVASGTAILQERQAFHDQVAGSLRDEAEQVLQRAIREKADIELQYRDRLTLAQEKLCLYQDKAQLLEEKLEIAKSAAEAAVQAVRSSRSTSSKLHPEDSSASGSVSSPPAKASPQALRESILVLQEQLQDREGQIEGLEQRLVAVDTEAPTRLKAQQTEITWLRELLGVRVDDLEDLIAALSQPVHNREAIKDAAIRLKANIEMEQQEKERWHNGSQSFPTLATISNLTSSPRSLPLAAAAAWGNWRKGRMAPAPNLFGYANGHLTETPSRSSPSTQRIMSGLMTPPHTEMGGEPEVRGYSKARVPPLSRSRPIPSTPRQSIGLPGRERPLTPSLTCRSNYDMDAESTDVGGLHSAVDGAERIEADGFEEEPFGPGIAAFPGHVQ
ncbi:MAG: hypothetical protein Q9186_003558 [Xanthomendoza sp. 1 TL-2023]